MDEPRGRRNTFDPHEAKYGYFYGYEANRILLRHEDYNRFTSSQLVKFRVATSDELEKGWMLRLCHCGKFVP